MFSLMKYSSYCGNLLPCINKRILFFISILNITINHDLSKYFNVYWQNQQKTCFLPLTNTNRLCHGRQFGVFHSKHGIGLWLSPLTMKKRQFGLTCLIWMQSYRNADRCDSFVKVDWIKELKSQCPLDLMISSIHCLPRHTLKDMKEWSYFWIVYNSKWWC